jgi:hypothetical protein
LSRKVDRTGTDCPMLVTKTSGFIATERDAHTER